jgi:hypothetical protein
MQTALHQTRLFEKQQQQVAISMCGLANEARL